MADTTKRGAGDTRGARIGRPPNDLDAREYWETPLHALLIRTMREVEPPVIKGERIDAAALAATCGVARYSVSRWFRRPRISAKAANKLVSIPESKLTKEDILPFVLD